MNNEKKLEDIKNLIEKKYPVYICECYLVQQISKIVNAKNKKK